MAGAYDYPVLITTSEELPEIVLSYLQGRSPENIFIIGGTGVISGKVETKCREFADSVIRLGGRTRYETAEAIYQYDETAYRTYDFRSPCADKTGKSNDFAFIEIRWIYLCPCRRRSSPP